MKARERRTLEGRQLKYWKWLRGREKERERGEKVARRYTLSIQFFFSYLFLTYFFCIYVYTSNWRYLCPIQVTLTLR